MKSVMLLLMLVLLLGAMPISATSFVPVNDLELRQATEETKIIVKEEVAVFSIPFSCEMSALVAEPIPQWSSKNDGKNNVRWRANRRT